MAGDKRLQIGAEELVRKFSFGTAWTKLRIGIRLSYANPSAINISELDCGLILGVCEGDTNTFSSPTTTNFVGIAPQTGGSYLWTGTWSYQGASPITYSIQTGNHCYLQKDPTGLSAATFAYTAASYITARPTTHACAYMLDITKQNNAVMFRMIGNNGSIDATQNVTQAAFLTMMENDNTNAGTSYNTTSVTTRTSSLPARTWDTMSISWNKCTKPFDLFDVAVARFY